MNQYWGGSVASVDSKAFWNLYLNTCKRFHVLPMSVSVVPVTQEKTLVIRTGCWYYSMLRGISSFGAHSSTLVPMEVDFTVLWWLTPTDIDNISVLRMPLLTASFMVCSLTYRVLLLAAPTKKKKERKAGKALIYNMVSRNGMSQATNCQVKAHSYEYAKHL